MAAIPHQTGYGIQATAMSNRVATQLKLVTFDGEAAEGARSRTRGLPKPGPDFRKLEPTPELPPDLQAANSRLEAATPEQIIPWAIEQYAPYLTMAPAFGPEGCVILAML